MGLYVISALVIAFLAILFALQNTNLVTIQLFIWEYRQSLALVLLGTLAIGVIVGLLVSVPSVIRRNVRISRLQKQTDSLLQQIDEKAQAVHSEAQKTNIVRQDYEEMLNSLGLLEPVTGLIRQELMLGAIATQLGQLQRQAGKASLPPLSVLMLQSTPKLEDGYALANILADIANSLRQQASSSIWFYSDGQGRFAATSTGLDQKATTRYAEELQAAILKNPPLAPNGKAIELDVSIGGAIAEVTGAIDAEQLVITAEQALEQALQRGRNRVRILSVT